MSSSNFISPSSSDKMAFFSIYSLSHPLVLPRRAATRGCWGYCTRRGDTALGLGGSFSGAGSAPASRRRPLYSQGFWCLVAPSFVSFLAADRKGEKPGGLASSLIIPGDRQLTVVSTMFIQGTTITSAVHCRTSPSLLVSQLSVNSLLLSLEHVVSLAVNVIENFLPATICDVALCTVSILKKKFPLFSALSFVIECFKGSSSSGLSTGISEGQPGQFLKGGVG